MRPLWHSKSGVCDGRKRRFPNLGRFNQKRCYRPGPSRILVEKSEGRLPSELEHQSAMCQCGSRLVCKIARCGYCTW